MSIRQVMSQRVTIKRPTFSQSATGADTRVEAVVEQDIRARVDRINSDELIYANHQGTITTHTIMLPKGANVSDKDTITWVHSGITDIFDVTDKPFEVRRKSRIHHIEVLAALRE